MIYKVNVDRTTWSGTQIVVEANSKKEAIAVATEKAKQMDWGIDEEVEYKGVVV